MGESSRIKELKRRVQLDPASIAFAALAEEYRRSGQFEDAIATCEAGLQRHPAYLSARVTLGRSLIAINRYEEAQEQLEHVLRVAPENLAAIRGLAEIHHRRGQLPEALEQYRSGAAPDAAEASPAPAAAIPPPAPSIPASASPMDLSAPSILSTPPAPPASVPAEPVAIPVAPVRAAVPVSRTDSVAPSTGTDPDAAALPALETFLGAILQAKDALPQRRS